jgi:hypothetical protein
MSGRWLILFASCCPCAWHGSVGIGLALPALASSAVLEALQGQHHEAAQSAIPSGHAGRRSWVDASIKIDRA